MSNGQDFKVTLAGLLIAIVVGAGVYFYNHSLSPANPNEILGASPAKISEQKLIIHVSGAVKKEGVYKLSPGDRVIDAIKLAGGECKNANLSSLNLAEELKDGQKIAVPEVVKEKPISKDFTLAKKTAVKNGLISLNSSSAEELDSLEGVGPATAQKIIESRPYTSIDDLKKVPRFGKNKIAKIKDKVCL